MIPSIAAASVAFWDGWLAWSRQQGIDHVIGRRLPATLAELGLDGFAASPSSDSAVQRRL